MTPLEKRLAAKLMRMAAEEFGNHGCNDMDLCKDLGFTPEESYELRKMITAEGDYPDDKVPQDRHYTMDFLCMSIMARKLEEDR